MRRFFACFLVISLSGCWGEKSGPPETGPKAAKEQAEKAPTSMTEKRSLDPVSTPIYAGEDAKAKIAKAVITPAIRGFQEAEGRHPTTLQELVDKKYLPSLPKPPAGYQFNYDSATGDFDVVLKPEPGTDAK
jgi:hypothetical protein